MTASPKGFPIEGRHDKDQEQLKQLRAKHSTVVPKGNNRRGLDVVGGGFADVTVLAVVEAGSDDNLIVITGHTVKAGDLIRIQTSANGIEEYEMFVEEVVDANSFKLAGATSALFAAGDTIDILRFVSPKLSLDGSTLATTISPPIQFVLDGVDTTVTEDTVTPSNNAALPVKLTNITGDINITANDLNVQTSHIGANADSVRVGDGTNLMGVNASLEALVNDADANTALTAILAKILAAPASEAKQDTAITALGSLLTELQLKADLSETQPVSMATFPLPTGASTEVTLAALLAAAATETTLASLSTAVAKETTLAATNVALASLLTELQLKADLLETQPVSATALPLPTGAATDTAVTDMSAKLPASLGKKANTASLSITMSNDEGSLPGSAFAVQTFVNHDMVATNITNAAYVELIADVGVISLKQLKIFMSSGTPLLLAIGAAASEVDTCIIPPGGFADGQIDIVVPANARISVKSLGGTVASGNIIINGMG